MQAEQKNLAILGTGSWGNTLAYLFGQQHKVVLWDYNASRVRRVQKTRRFKKPSVLKYPDNVTITNNLEDIKDAEIIINAVPLKGVKDCFKAVKVLDLPEDRIVVNGSKGIDPISLKTATQLIEEQLPNNPVAVLSGPNLAREMIEAKPMVAAIAAKDIEVAEKVQKILCTPSYRLYTNTDPRGVEYCAALKNVIAIAAGSADGLNLGQSANASLITRGLNEMGRFITSYGDGNYETVLSSAGIGDLIATCSSNLSRNHKIGYYLAKGKSLDQAIQIVGEVAEGINTTYAVQKICEEHGITMPIVEQVYLALQGLNTPVDAVLNLMNRPLATETI